MCLCVCVCTETIDVSKLQYKYSEDKFKPSSSLYWLNYDFSFKGLQGWKWKIRNAVLCACGSGSGCHVVLVRHTSYARLQTPYQREPYFGNRGIIWGFWSSHKVAYFCAKEKY